MLVKPHKGELCFKSGDNGSTLWVVMSLLCFFINLSYVWGRKFTFRKRTGFHAPQNPNQTEVFVLQGKFKTKTKLTYHILSLFFVPAQLMKAEVCSFHKIISKLLWQSSGNGSCSFLYQLSDLYLASLQKQSLSSQLVWSGRF